MDGPGASPGVSQSSTSTSSIQLTQLFGRPSDAIFQAVVDYFFALEDTHGNTKISSLKEPIRANARLLETEILKTFDLLDKLIVENKARSLELQVANNFLAQRDETIVQLNKEIVEIKVKKFDEICSSLASIPHANQTRVCVNKIPSSSCFADRSYSQAVSQTQQPQPSKPKHVVIIQPKDVTSVSTSEQTLKVFKLTVDPKIFKENKIRINSKKFTTKNRVVVACDSRSECEALCKAMESNPTISAMLPKKRSPRIQILGIEENVVKEEIFDYILNQNPGLEEFSDCKFDVKFEKIDRLGSKYVVVDVDSKLFVKLIEMKKVCISLSSCPVKKHVRVFRCFKCQRYGHFKQTCRNVVACAVCAGPHETKDCTVHDEKCSNCAWVDEKRKQRNQQPFGCDHRADSRTCRSYLKMYEMVETQFDCG